MNYIAEIKAFYDWLGANPMPVYAIALWHALMDIANGANWPERISPSLSTLQSKCCSSKDAICKARNVLQQKGLIDWKERKGKQSALYELIPFVSVKKTQQATQGATQQATQGATQQATQGATIYKLNETKLNQTKKKGTSVPQKEKQRFIPPAVEEVAAYCAKRSNGIDAGMFVDYYASKGWNVGKDPMVDWKAAVRTWERRRKEESVQAGTDWGEYET